MIIVEPIKLGDPQVSGGGGSYYVRDGVLKTAPPNTLRVTYDPFDLSKAPYALVEPEEFTNLIHNNTMVGAATGVPGTLPARWLISSSALTRSIPYMGQESGIDFIDVRLSGTSNEAIQIQFEGSAEIPVAAGETVIGVTYVSQIGGSLANVSRISSRMREALSDGAFVSDDLLTITPQFGPLREQEFEHRKVIGPTSTRVTLQILVMVNGFVDFTLRIGLPQLYSKKRPATPIRTNNNGPVTRAADVIGAGAGLVFSNVPIVEPAYDAKATYAKDAYVYDPATYELFQSLIADNVGKALNDTSAWSPRGAINRRAMFDDYNNTQTTMPDEIVVVLSAEMVAQGLYLGNLDVDEVLVSMVDAVDGVVYSETTDLIESNSKSSYFNWMFKRIKRRTYFFTLDLPVYARGLVTVCLRKIGGTAKCGMCVIGPVDEFGPTLLGLSTEGKDFSSTTFNFDGTSKTTIRPYAKRMSCDVVVPNDEITYVQDRLFELRQRALVWVGGPYGATAVFGRYGSFKNVIEYQMQSKMNLTIEGAV